MDREEFEKLKAREREHLEKMRELKQAVHRLERQRSVMDALHRLQDSAREMLHRNVDLVDDLARETAFLEAKADMALEEQEDASIPSLDPEVADQELRRLRAQKLIEQLKQEVEEHGPAPSGGPPDLKAGDEPKEDVPPPPDKTIGRMR